MHFASVQGSPNAGNQPSVTRTSERTRPSVGERSQLQLTRRADTAAAPASDDDELAAWGEGEAEAGAASPVQTPLVESFDLGADRDELRGTGGARVLDDEQQAAVVRRLLLGELSAEEACAVHRVTREQLTQWVRRHRRAVRRAIEEQIGSALSAQGLDKEDFVLSGNLESMSLSDLLETIQLGRKNAHVRLESGSEVGELWFADGDVIDARTGNLVGTPAVYHLLELKEGKLQAEFCSTERERTILASTETLLIESARRADERKRLRDQLGDLQRVFVASVGAGQAASLEPRRRELLQAFDGTRTVQSVLASSEWPEFETLTVISELLAQKQLVPVTTPRVSEQPAPAVSRVAQTGYASLFPSNAGPATLPSASQPEAASAPPSSQAVSSQAAPSQALSARGGASITLPPIVPSVALLQSMPAFARRSAPFVLGAGALVLAFAVGLWSARSPAPARAPQLEPAARGTEATLTEALCGPGMELFTPGGSGAERPFCLAQRSVTTAEYQECVDGKHCEPTLADAVPGPGETEAAKARCNAGQPGREQLPINCVTQRQAEQYCEWRGQRLPLPGEWELAWQASRSTPGAKVSFTAAGLDSPLGELSEWTRERGSGAAPHGEAALGEAAPSGEAAPAAAPSEATAEGQPSAAEAAPPVDNAADSPPDTVEAIVHEPAAAQPFAVLRAPAPAAAAPDARPKRLYTSASAQGRGIGFRCAVSLEPTR